MTQGDSIPFDKMHGSGNDFIVIREGDLGLIDVDFPAFVRNACRRGMSVGADGVIVIGSSDEADFSWRYYNADGSEGEMCGNGAMVGARYASNHGIAPDNCTFTTPAGIVKAEVNREQVSLQMMDAQLVETDMHLAALPGVAFDRFMIGVPHVVGIVDDVDAMVDFDTLGLALRTDPTLDPSGANINLVSVVDGKTIRMRTYERGVEAETLACGTGAVCSAIAAARRGIVQQPVSVKVSSGLYLNVTWIDDGDDARQIQLTGTARTVAQGALLPDALL